MGEARHIIRRTGVVSFFTFLSRLSGLARDSITAYAFGAGISTDIFYIAFRIPNLFRRLLAEGALTNAMVPIFTEALGEGKEEARRLVTATFSWLLVVLSLFVLLGIVFSNYLVMGIAAGFRDDPEKLQLTISITRWVFPYLAFVSLGALAMGILNALKRFAAPAFSPVLLNLGLIIGSVWIARFVDPPVYGLAFGVLLGGALQVLSQIPSLRAVGFMPQFSLRMAHGRLKEIGKMMLPGVYGTAVYQLNVFFISFFASFLPVGAVTYLWYAGRIMEFPLGVFGIAMATAILPSFSDAAVSQDKAEFKRQLRLGMEGTCFINLPATVGLMVLARPIVSLLLFRGAFTEESMVETARDLVAFAVGLPFVSAARVLSSAYYACKLPKVPVRAATVAMLANLVFCLVLKGPLGHVGLALATSLSSLVNCAVLSYSIRACGVDMEWRSLFASIAKIALASAVMGGAIHLASVGYGRDPAYLSFWGQMAYTMTAVILGVVVYGLASWRHPAVKVLRQRFAA